MYSVYQHWDPLRVCIVGKSYSPSFYKFIKNAKVRNVMERIAYETEEDYQKLVKVLESFGVEVLRPNVSSNHEEYLEYGRIIPPPMTPRDYTIMLGENFYFYSYSTLQTLEEFWDIWKGSDWPEKSPKTPSEIKNLPLSVQEELVNSFQLHDLTADLSMPRPLDLNQLSARDSFTWKHILQNIKNNNNKIFREVPKCLSGFSAATSTRIGKDIYLGTRFKNQNKSYEAEQCALIHTDYRWHVVDTAGHSDGVFCPVKPGLIVSLKDIPTYKDSFPGWEVVYLPGQSWNKVEKFLKLKEKNKGKWWVPGEELNDDFTNFVESWLSHWVGYVEETVFDVNMLVIDEKNVVCNNYNKEVFAAFDRHGITPHIVNFRHRYFWDGGLHCITSDIHRDGHMNDYFPERN